MRSINLFSLFEMKEESIVSNKKIFYLQIFLFSIIYSYIISNFGKIFDHVISVAYIILLIVNFLWANKLKASNALLVYTCILLHLGILVGSLLSPDPQLILWGADSIGYHVPGSVNVFTNLQNFFSNTSYFGTRVLTTHIITGVFFKILGINVVATTLSTLLFKIPTILLIKKLGDRLGGFGVGQMASLLFIFAPGVIVYDVIFFKEISVQLYLITFFLNIVIYLDDRKKRNLIWAICGLLLVGYERVYLFPPLCFGLVVSIMYKVKRNGMTKDWAWIIGVLSFAAALFILYYLSIFPIDRIHIKFMELKRDYMAIPDVTDINRNLPYFLAYLKVTFTPYFTLNKFETYTDISILIMWGALINNFIMFGNAITMIKQTLKNKSHHLLISSSFFSYLAILAYFRPFDSRVRDSFFPVIVVYFSYYLVNFLKKCKNKNLRLQMFIDN